MWFASEVAHSTFTTSTRACTDITHQNNEPAKRFLRTDQTVEKGEDSDEAERLYIPGLETATNYLKSMIGPTVASPNNSRPGSWVKNLRTTSSSFSSWIRPETTSLRTPTWTVGSHLVIVQFFSFRYLTKRWTLG
nr:hypothetical protein KRP22_14270 [Phytophthora ramorum]